MEYDKNNKDQIGKDDFLLAVANGILDSTFSDPLIEKTLIKP